jgi:hypothetical protein
MSCGGGHLGFPIHIKNRNLVKNILMIIHLQLGFSQFISFREEDLYCLIIYIDGRILWCIIFAIFSSPGPKVHGNYCHHLASVRSSWIFNMAARANNMLWLAEISKIKLSNSIMVIQWNYYKSCEQEKSKILFIVTVTFDLMTPK